MTAVPLEASRFHRDEITRIVTAAVDGATFEIEHALDLARHHHLAEWLRNDLAAALLELEDIVQHLGRSR